MKNFINSTTLRSRMEEILRRASKGERFTVLYRSRPVCQIIPVGAGIPSGGKLEDDPIFKAGPVGRSRDGKTPADHDEFLYGSRR